jgi:ATP-dependent RNA helicase SUPV3L1/SUV3
MLKIDDRFSGNPLKGRLTERLLAQGLLTPSMLQELRKEWDRSSNKGSDHHSDDESDRNSPFARKQQRDHHLRRFIRKTKKF